MRGMTLLALVTLTSSLGAQEGDFMWRGQIAQGDVIEIRGVNGDVRVLPATGREVEVTATKRADRSDPEDVRIEVVTHSDGVTICALYPQRRGGYSECEQGGPRENSTRRNDVEVDWTVLVPVGVEVLGYTINGDVDARGLESNAFLGTVNGDVDVETSGYAEASTVNGSIDAEMGRADWAGTLRFSTVNGSISITVPDGFEAEVEGRTVNGGLETDFPLTIRGRFGPRRFSGTIGDGGRGLDMNTVNGSLRILRR